MPLRSFPIADLAMEHGEVVERFEPGAVRRDGALEIPPREIELAEAICGRRPVVEEPRIPGIPGESLPVKGLRALDLVVRHVQVAEQGVEAPVVSALRERGLEALLRSAERVAGAVFGAAVYDELREGAIRSAGEAHAADIGRRENARNVSSRRFDVAIPDGGADREEDRACAHDRGRERKSGRERREADAPRERGSGRNTRRSPERRSTAILSGASKRARRARFPHPARSSPRARPSRR